MNAKWSEHGKSAGPTRNREMAEIAEQLIAIPDAKSKGTRNMITAAVDAGIPQERIFVYWV